MHTVEAEPLAAMRARYPKALEFVYDSTAIITGNAIRPGECASSVFDFTDGVRLIVSRERMPDGSVVLHLSASFKNGGKASRAFRSNRAKYGINDAVQQWMTAAVTHFQEISGDRREPHFLGFSQGTVIQHWIIPEKPT
jgi:hypothetical protein